MLGGLFCRLFLSLAAPIGVHLQIANPKDPAEQLGILRIFGMILDLLRAIWLYWEFLIQKP
ncbi:MAG: hypothetical protein BJG00_015300 [Limnothrix sp. CACIAM 69d]|nr:MAG: hypothetical protein BJG00_015300 [Limnothrix sp. CACIAM 69d]